MKSNLSKWIAYMKKTSLWAWLQYMCSCIPPIKIEKYGAVTIYDFMSYKEAVIDASSSNAFYIPKDIYVRSVRFDRVFPENKVQTIVFPFNVNAQSIAGATFHSVTGVNLDESKCYFKEETGELLAYRPYICIASSAQIEIDGPVVLKRTIPNDYTIPGSLWEVRGVYEKITFGERDDLYGRAYGFAGEAREDYTVGQFVQAGKNASIAPLKAYLFNGGD